MALTQNQQQDVARKLLSITQRELVGLAWLAEQKRAERGEEQTDKLLKGYEELRIQRNWQVL